MKLNLMVCLSNDILKNQETQTMIQLLCYSFARNSMMLTLYQVWMNYTVNPTLRNHQRRGQKQVKRKEWQQFRILT